jgi:hypothetical protein
MLVMSLYIGYCNKVEVGDLETNEANFLVLEHIAR